MTQQNDKTKSRAFFLRRDILLVGVLLLGALVWLALALPRQAAGPTATVTVGVGPNAAVQTLSLAEDRILFIDAKLPVQLEIKDAAIRFVHPVCPDHTCTGFGWLKREGEWALCAPAEVMVRIHSES